MVRRLFDLQKDLFVDAKQEQLTKLSKLDKFLYQADWLLRFYHFRAEELLDEAHPNFNPLVDPKCSWALSHPEFFPVEVNRADYEALLRVPGIGVTSARRILVARRCAPLTFAGLKKLRGWLKSVHTPIVGVTIQSLAVPHSGFSFLTSACLLPLRARISLPKRFY